MAAKLDKDTYLYWYELMLRLRRFEERAGMLYGQQKIRGFCHLYIGQEAVAAGTMSGLRADDRVITAYRDHGLAIAKGISCNQAMAELYGKATGCTKGKGGSMHFFSKEHNFYGGHGIVGAQIGLGAGIAFADQYLGKDNVTICFFGDGAVAEGAFHESMNLAALWKLPLLFCCENNLYAMGTALERHQAQTDLCAKAASYAMAAQSADGMDIVAVHEAAKDAVARIRSGDGPGFLELRTYRFRAHSMYDPDLYRQATELQAWKAIGPIHTFTARLKAEGKLTEEAFLALDAAVNAEVAKAEAFADDGTWEPVDDLLKDVYTPAGAAP